MLLKDSKELLEAVAPKEKWIEALRKASSTAGRKSKYVRLGTKDSMPNINEVDEDDENIFDESDQKNIRYSSMLDTKN
jgi:hypothetical protein